VGAPPAHEVTGLLQAWSAGDEEALRKLMPLVYRELHRAARRYMIGERSGHTLQATALINEVYMRLVDVRRIDWQNRAHFFAICAQLMRRILVDYARTRNYQKRGTGVRAVSLVENLDAAPEKGTDLVALDDALRILSQMSPRQGRIVELRFFGGLSIEETSAFLGVSRATVERDWAVARAWTKSPCCWVVRAK